MYSIAICDDEVFTCSKIEQILLTHATDHKIRLDMAVFYKGETLVDELERGKYFDIIFLDVDLLTMSGVDIGAKIRNEFANEVTKIIYISSKSSYAMQLFRTRPMDFLVKPLQEKDVIEVFIQAVKTLNLGNQIFEFSVGRTDYRVPYKDILYFRSIGRKILLVLEKKELEFYQKLDVVLEQLPSWEFLQIHKSYIVNCNNVTKYTYETMVMRNGQVIPISQTKRKTVREQLFIRKREKGNGY